jgi:hypothetical protein
MVDGVRTGGRGQAQGRVSAVEASPGGTAEEALAAAMQAKETASSLDTSVASANSALQRARATLRKHLPVRRLEWAPGVDPSQEERVLLQRWVDASSGPTPPPSLSC